MAQICMMSWDLGSFRRTFPSVRKAFPDERILLCVPEKRVDEYLEFGNEKVGIFTCERANELFDWHGEKKRESSFGHVRNLLLLASKATDKKQNLIFFDDDIVPDEGTEKSFEKAFKKYDLVCGNYSGITGNCVYGLVFFFELLHSVGWKENLNTALAYLGRAVPQKGVDLSTVHGLSGGIMGASARLRDQVLFTPTNYHMDDRFFEFCCKFYLRGWRFMDEKTAASEIPVATHCPGAKKEGALVDGYIEQVRAAVVEKYMCFRLSGAIGRIVNGGYLLIKSEKFDQGEVAKETAREAAVEKFRQAAKYWLTRNPPDVISGQLERVAKLSEKDFVLKKEELEGEWQSFQDEGAWFKKKIAEPGAGVSGLFTD